MLARLRWISRFLWRLVKQLMHVVSLTHTLKCFLVAMAAPPAIGGNNKRGVGGGSEGRENERETYICIQRERKVQKDNKSGKLVTFHLFPSKNNLHL